MQPPLTIVTFTAGAPRGTSGHGGEFRHVIGSSTVEVLGKDELGDPTWQPCGQRSCPLTVEEVRAHALNALSRYVAQSRHTDDKRPPTMPSNIFHTERGMQIRLGRIA